MRTSALLIGVGVFFLDLITKWWVTQNLWLHYYPVIEGFFRIQYVRNTGIAFGLFHQTNSPWKSTILSLVAVVAVLVVLYYVHNTPASERLTFVSLGLLLGGILGNFTDRLSHDYVIDFLTLHWKDYFVWPTFNIADASITLGVFLIIYKTFATDSEERLNAGACLMVPFLLSPAQLTAEEIITKLEAKYEQIESLRANFEHILVNRGFSQRESGIVIVKRPGRMYWEYQVPTVKFFVADAGRSYFYVPHDKQMLVTDLDLNDPYSPFFLLLGNTDIDENFDVSLEEPPPRSEVEDSVWLRLTPRLPQPEFSYLLLEVLEADFSVRQLTVVEPIGQENVYRLLDVQQNVAVPDRQFQLDVPSDVEVIEQ